jgi:hypothetical protein
MTPPPSSPAAGYPWTPSTVGRREVGPHPARPATARLTTISQRLHGGDHPRHRGVTARARPMTQSTNPAERSRPIARLRGLLPTILFPLALACGDESLPRIRYETAEARIGTDFEQALCSHDLAWVDEHIGFLEDVLDAHSDEPVEIYVYVGGPPQCRGLGCYTAEGYVAGDWSSLDHEIVHAIVDRFADPPLFVSEGIAEALSGRGTQRGSTTVAENLDERDPGKLSYYTAGHFMRWLVEERGDVADVRALLETGDASAIYGGSLEALGAEYEESAPFSFPPWSPCNYTSLARVGEEHWRERVELTCDHPDATRFGEGWVSLLRSVELSGGTYELHVEGGRGARLLGCQQEVLYEPPPDMAFGDTQSSAEWLQTARGVLFESGRTHVLELKAGRYRIEVPSELDSEEMAIELRGLE